MITDTTYEHHAKLVLAFIQRTGRRPSVRRLEERQIHQMYRRLTGPSSRKDTQFKQTVECLIGPPRRGPEPKKPITLYRIYKWIKQHSRRLKPSRGLEEYHLSRRIYDLTSPKSKHFNQRVVDSLNLFCPKVNHMAERGRQRRQQCLDFIKEQGRRPRSYKQGVPPFEYSMYLVTQHARREQKSDPEAAKFIQEINTICPRIWKYQIKAQTKIRRGGTREPDYYRSERVTALVQRLLLSGVTDLTLIVRSILHEIRTQQIKKPKSLLILYTTLKTAVLDTLFAHDPRIKTYKDVVRIYGRAWRITPKQIMNLDAEHLIPFRTPPELTQRYGVTPRKPKPRPKRWANVPQTS